MNLNLSSELFEKYKKFTKDICGIVLTDNLKFQFESRLVHMLTTYRIFSFEEFYEFVIQTKDEDIINNYIDSICINETMWFRDKCFNEYTDAFMPELLDKVRKGEKARIWSAACSTGQEPYSIAMGIEEYLEANRINDVKLTDFEIIASDISNQVLRIAKKGIYDKININRGLPEELKTKYFSSDGRSFTLNDEIRSIVQFNKFNLTNLFESCGKFDIIFLRYVLIYFDKNLKYDIIKKSNSILNENGKLVIGAGEILRDYEEYYSQAKTENGTYFTKK